MTSSDDLHRDAERVREIVARVTNAGRALPGLGAARVARTLGQATRQLADPSTELGQRARAWLPESTGLSAAMVDWALRTNVAPYHEEALRTLARRLRAHGGAPDHVRLVPPRLAATVLAGNVFTASLRSLVLPLLAGGPVVAKASWRDDAFPRLLEQALREIDPELAPCMAVVTFPRGREELEDVLWGHADVIHVYGSDATVAAVRARVPATTTVVPHGHGLGVLYVGAAALDESPRDVAAAAALDIAAFDQRGCLSPHAVCVQRGGRLEGRDFARLLADEGLSPLATRLPRGALPTEVGAAQVQWRGVAAARGELYEGDGYAVGWEADASLRVSPGWRNVQVITCDGPAELARRVAPLGMHLKALGVAGDEAERPRVAAALSPPSAPRICPCGEMQIPPVDGLADGDWPWSGTGRWIDLR